MQKLLPLAKVKEVTGYARSSIYAYVSEGRFPRPVKIGERRVAWVESEVADWIKAKIAERDSQREPEAA